MRFVWDETKNLLNQQKHGVSFEVAQRAFLDEKYCIVKDIANSTSTETRYFCLGNIDGEILTVRFTIRQDTIRIFGAGYWRKGRKTYEQKNSLHR